jgi:aminoglycoside phosphotransferase (APT) family kinase protein
MAMMKDDGAPAEALDESSIAMALRRMGIAGEGERLRCRPLKGGVSSDIWLIELGGKRLCLKRALPRLRVAARWEAPVERNAYEWAWFRTVGRICPRAVPPLYGHDAAAGLFVMGYLDPASYPLWKARLAAGEADLRAAAAVGARLRCIHAHTAGDEEIARAFSTDAGFHAIRLEPYLLAAARQHPDLALRLEELARRTAGTKLALIHGDVSPKNILLGPEGPVFLDAECAWYGDPAFDLAFCLNHLLLKCLLVPTAAARFLRAFDTLAESYFERVTWEPRERIEARAARLLPGLLLARIDGKSPVEYVTQEADKERIRKMARVHLLEPPSRLRQVRAAWAAEVGA